MAALSTAAAPVLGPLERDLASRPFRDWDEAFDCFRQAAVQEPLVVILDEFPELVRAVFA